MNRISSLQLVGSFPAKRLGVRLPWSVLIAVVIACLSFFRAAVGDDRVAAILDDTGVKGGLVVHVGCGDGKLTAALRANDSYLVHGLDADAENVAAAREHIQSLGLYGNVSVDRLRGGRLPYADNLVNLVVMQDAGRGIRDEEILRVLVPGGVLLKISPDTRNPTPGTSIRKPWPAGLDQWTHWDHGPDRNPVSQDVFVGPPRRTQWMDGPAWSKKHWGPRISAMVTAG
nr:class I SAM-dependent methyltransferase [Planctomycetota bacterium]